MSLGNRDTSSQAGLLRQALEGDAVAFWKLVQPHERTVHAVAVGICRDSERAADIVHDVYVRAFSTLGNLRSPDKLGSWMYTMARNIAHEHLRGEQKQQRIGAAQPHQTVISVPDMLIREEEFRVMEGAMAELPEPHRIVLGLKYMNNMSCREIAETLDIGIEAAKSRLFEARKALRARMEAAQKSATLHPTRHARGEQ